MFAKEYRLPATVRLAHSHFLRMPNWSMKYHPNTVGHNRYGFVIRKQVDKRAVVRNRIRRLFRSCLEQLHPTLSPGYDMLFFLEKGIMDQQQAALTEEISKQFRIKHLLA